MRNSDRPSRPRKDSTEKSFGKSNSSRSFGDKPKPRFSDDKPSFKKRDDDRKPRFSDDKPSFRKREDDRKPFGERSDRKPRFSDDKPSFRKREDSGDRKPRFSDDKPTFRKREESGDRKPRFSDDKPTFRKREDSGDRKPRFSDDRPTFRKRDDSGDRKPRFSDDKPTFRKRDDSGDRKPRFSDDKPNFRKREDSGDRKPRFSDDKPTFRKREDSGDRKPRFSDDKPSFKKRDEDDSYTYKRYDEERPAKKGRFESKDNQATTSRKYAPNFNFERIKDNLPEKIQRKVFKEERQKSDEIRLNRYIANAGITSRRDADELIATGQITVNGKVITEMGYKVKPDDVVKYGKKVLNREKLVYLLLNKPKDFITTTDDPEERNTVMDLVANACNERIYPVGRLDRNTTGLLLMTNDGELAEKLSHPSNEIKKIYQVELNKPFTEEHFDMMKKGFELEDGFIKADDLSIITPDAEVIGIDIHSGRNRIVRRMFEHLGYEVLKLDRTTYAGLTKKDLPRGKWRFLTEKEVIRLKYMI